MSQLINASIDVTTLLAMANSRHSAFTVGKNGKTYCNVQIWINDEPDKFGDHASIQLNHAKDMAEKDRFNPSNWQGWPAAKKVLCRPWQTFRPFPKTTRQLHSVRFEARQQHLRKPTTRAPRAALPICSKVQTVSGKRLAPVYRSNPHTGRHQPTPPYF
jgi:hypothetical protein